MRESALLKVTGMKCGGCETNVTNKLSELDGVVYVKASSQAQQVQVEFMDEKISLPAIHEAIAQAGFTVILT